MRLLIALVVGLAVGCLSKRTYQLPKGMPWQGKSAIDSVGRWERVHHSLDESGTVSSTFRSLPLRMLPGQVIFTDASSTVVPFPDGQYAITFFVAEVVDEFNNSVPLSEVYLHHWVFYNGYGNAGMCGPQSGINYVFGIGSESRRTATAFPAPYGFLVDGTELWTANIHAINTRYVPNVKECIECHCEGQNGGGFMCCSDGSFCPTTAYPPDSAKTYYLQYTMTYVPITPEVIPVKVYVLDVTDCMIEYNISQCAQEPCISPLSLIVPLPEDIDVVYIQGHIHIGGINFTVTYVPQQGQSEILCTTLPIYGSNGNQPGNETGYIVEFNRCFFSEPKHLPYGGQIVVEAVYHSDPFRDGVMGLGYVAAVDHEALEQVKKLPMLVDKSLAEEFMKSKHILV